jgi:transposase
MSWKARSSAAACSVTGIRNSSASSTAIEATVPVGKVVHVILDNYGAHKHGKVRTWLDRHPRFVFHSTPTSASWLNAVEGFFAKLTKRRLKRGVFRSLGESRPPSTASSMKPSG